MRLGVVLNALCALAAVVLALLAWAGMIAPHGEVVAAGALAGLLCALGGALKDSPFEGFKPLTFTRSIWAGFFAGFLVSAVLDSVYAPASFFLALPCCGWLERCAVEGYKILRAQKPGKFDSGSRGHTGPVHRHGRPVPTCGELRELIYCAERGIALQGGVLLKTLRYALACQSRGAYGN